MAVLQPGATIGLIGGGQLARMMAVAAARLGYKTIVLEPLKDCPAAQTANKQIVAAYDDFAALDELTRLCDVITYEFENVPASATQHLSIQKAVVLPKPVALEISQDRVFEKEFLNQCGIMTAPWHKVDTLDELKIALKAFSNQGILKTRRLGYDGKGQVRLQKADDLAAQAAMDAIKNAPAILEGFIAFEKEISVIAARDQNGNIAFFDSAENVHRDGILRVSTVPATVLAKTEQAAREATQKILQGLDYVGVIGVEFFVMQDGSVLANEMAPRVHNSGHWTEAACLISQFEQHIRAVAGLPLGAGQRHSDCVMENLIGDDIKRLDALLKEPQTYITLYGKSDVRAGRKMGHFTRISPKKCG